MTLEVGIRRDPHTHGYRHDAFFYSGMDEFIRGTAQFLRDGLAERAAMLVVVSAEKIERLKAELGDGAESITFRDMSEVGKNPARISPVWQAWVQEQMSAGRPLRGIGEPATPDRRFDELMECARHESFLNIAFEGSEPFWLLCPYDMATLERNVVDEARRTHPSWIADGEGRASDDYVPVDTVAPFSPPLPPLLGSVESVQFIDDEMRLVRELTSKAAQTAGFSRDKEWDLVLAVNELATNSIRHGGGVGTLRVAVEGDRVVCEVSDQGHIRDPLIGRVPPDAAGSSGRGLWIANQLCDLVQLHSTPSGTTVRLTMRA